MSTTVFWQDSNRTLALQGRVVPREDWLRLFDTVTTLREAQAMRQAEHERLLQAQAAAEQQGFAAGLEAGRQQALNEVLALLHDKEKLLQALHQQLASLVQQGLHAVLERLDERTLLQAQVSQCLAAVRGCARARLLVAPSQVDEVRRWVTKTAQDTSPWLEVQACDTLAATDAVVEGDGVVLDGRLHARLDQWREALRVQWQASSDDGKEPSDAQH